MRTVRVKPGRAKPLWRGHPWVFADSVASIAPSADAGDAAAPTPPDWVRVIDDKGRTIGHGLLSEASAIRVRLLSFDGASIDDTAVLSARIHAAWALRARLFPDPTTTDAYRLVHAEGDGLPGLVVDRYADVLVAQFATAPMARRRTMLAEKLLVTTGAKSLVARPAGFEREEGLPVDVAFEAGEAVSDRVSIVEAGCRFLLDPRKGQKTGHFADQRENRTLVAQVATDARVLDLYAGTGGFTLQALRAGATSVRAVDVSKRSMESLQRNAEANDVAAQVTPLVADVTDVLRALKGAGERFDLVIADPPNFFPRRGPDRGATKAYRELNVRALGRVATDGGMLATFSCSPRLDSAGLLAMLQSAGRECRRTFRVLRPLTAGPDHPVVAGAALGRYLSGWLVAVDPQDGP